MPGARLEREFGQSNWRDLYSVIVGTGEYRAVTPDPGTGARLAFPSPVEAGEW